MRERLWSGATLCNAAIEINGQTLEPDESKAYVEFKLGHAFTKASQVITAYGTALHPGTVSNSYRSMMHQVFDLGHKLRAYDKSKERDQIPRDYILGTVVGVDFPKPPSEGWSVNLESAPAIRGVAVIHKQAEKVPQVLGEHLGGRRKWTVSMEVNYSLLQSGFIVGNLDAATKKQSDLLKDSTPAEFNALGLGYVAVENAPEDLLESWHFEKRKVTGPWGKLPVTLLKGGINGAVHFMGVGLVHYGAEREAEVQQILASDPDRMDELLEEGVATVAGYFRQVQADSEAWLKALGITGME